VSLLKHKPGDENPNFLPPKGIVHTPKSATLDPSAQSIIFDYDGDRMRRAGQHRRQG
jgi:hypothetical protein